MKTIALFLDAFRYEDLSRENCPYIYGLAKNGAYGRMETLAGYHVEYSMLSGYYPLRHNAWIWYYYDEKNSCFKWTRFFEPMLKALDKTRFRKISRNFISYATMTLRYARGKTRLLKVNEIPIDKIKKFNISVDKIYTDKNSLNVPTLFDLLRKNNTRFLALEYPWIADNNGMRLTLFMKQDRDNINLLKRKLKDNYGFYYCHVWNLDSLQHKYGVKSSEAMKHIRSMDNGVKELVEEAKKYGDVNVVIFSDHGMTPVKETVDALGIIKGYDAEYFIGSTTMQIWLRDIAKKNELRNKFLKAGCIAYDEGNIKELRIPYKREFVGDLLIAAKPGCQFYPDFFRKDKNARAMHGYTKKNNDLDGIFIVNCRYGRKGIIKKCSLVDIVPTILKAIGIKTNEKYDGKARI